MPDRTTRRGKQHQHEKVMRKARRQLKRNRKPRVRDKSWTQYDLDAYEDLDVPDDEPIVPRGEHERRRAALAAITQQLTAGEAELEDSTEGWRGGLVTRVSSGFYQVDSEEGRFTCSVRGSLTAYDTGYTNVVAVGDEVLFSTVGSKQGVIERVLPRRTCLSRPDVFHAHLRQVVVANVDQLLIVSSLKDPAVWFELIDRYLIASDRHGLRPVICVNKTDLASGEEVYQQPMLPYLSMGHEVLFTSATTGQGVDELRAALRDRGTVLAGLSGVGKSSLLNKVEPGLGLKTGLVSDRHHEGRHTTVEVSLIPLKMGGYVVDTPGVRQFGLWDVSREELASYFPEVFDRAAGCRFPNCSHTHEPGCAVRSAADRGEIPASRYDSYVKIYG